MSNNTNYEYNQSRKYDEELKKAIDKLMLKQLMEDKSMEFSRYFSEVDVKNILNRIGVPSTDYKMIIPTSKYDSNGIIVKLV